MGACVDGRDGQQEEEFRLGRVELVGLRVCEPLSTGGSWEAMLRPDRSGRPPHNARIALRLRRGRRSSGVGAPAVGGHRGGPHASSCHRMVSLHAHSVRQN